MSTQLKTMRPKPSAPPENPATALRDFLEIPYDQLEEMNLEAKQQRLDRVDPDEIARASASSTCRTRSASRP